MHMLISVPLRESRAACVCERTVPCGVLSDCFILKGILQWSSYCSQRDIAKTGMITLLDLKLYHHMEISESKPSRRATTGEIFYLLTATMTYEIICAAAGRARHTLRARRATHTQTRLQLSKWHILDTEWSCANKGYFEDLCYTHFRPWETTHIMLSVRNYNLQAGIRKTLYLR